MRTRNDEDYINDKDVLNAAMIEIRNSKRNYQQQLTCIFKNYGTSFYVICWGQSLAYMIIRF